MQPKTENYELSDAASRVRELPVDSVVANAGAISALKRFRRHEIVGLATPPAPRGDGYLGLGVRMSRSSGLRHASLKGDSGIPTDAGLIVPDGFPADAVADGSLSQQSRDSWLHADRRSGPMLAAAKTQSPTAHATQGVSLRRGMK